MSGIEIVGVVASTLQLAEIGMKLSVRLCSFYHQLKDANRSIQTLSSDVSLTCSILHEFAMTLQQDDQTRVCSGQMFHTAQNVLSDCDSTFEQITKMLGKQVSKFEGSRFQRTTGRITMVLLRPDVEVLHGNLDRIRSTMLLMLNVIIYARGVRRKEESSEIGDQENLIKSLLRKGVSASQLGLSAEAGQPAQPPVANACSFLASGVRSESESKQPHGKQPLSPSSSLDELIEYYKLISNLLDEVDTCHIDIERDRSLRIRNGIVNVHSKEARTLYERHGDLVTRLFDQSKFRIKDLTTAPDVSAVHGKKPPSTAESQYRTDPANESFDDVYRTVSNGSASTISTQESNSGGYFRKRMETFLGDGRGESGEGGKSNEKQGEGLLANRKDRFQFSPNLLPADNEDGEPWGLDTGLDHMEGIAGPPTPTTEETFKELILHWTCLRTEEISSLCAGKCLRGAQLGTYSRGVNLEKGFGDNQELG